MLKFKYLYLITTFLYLSLSFLPQKVGSIESGGQTKVKAEIQTALHLRIYGYTAPNAIVQADGYRVFAQVSSEADGYFLIDPLPISSEAKEVCLTTIDSERKVGFPLCIGVPDPLSGVAEIGPLLLSPTLGISAGTIWQNQTVAASGYTLPNTKVVLSFFEATKVTSNQNLTATLANILNPEAAAANLPSFVTSSNKRGVFNISLPTEKGGGYRLFAKAFYRESPTSKSQTLLYRVGSFWEYWRRYILPKLILILLALGILIYLIVQERKTKKIKTWLIAFNEKRLSPSVVRLRLSLRRLWYNLREFWRSSRK